jgi:hypothetical protein
MPAVPNLHTLNADAEPFEDFEAEMIGTLMQLIGPDASQMVNALQQLAAKLSIECGFDVDDVLTGMKMHYDLAEAARSGHLN